MSQRVLYKHLRENGFIKRERPILTDEQKQFLLLSHSQKKALIHLLSLNPDKTEFKAYLAFWRNYKR